MVTVMDEPGVPARLPETIGPITVAEIAGGDLQEGQGLDFKREVHVDKPEAKARLLDDVVAFLNRGPARLVIGVEEKGGRFDSFRPQQGDADKAALRLQTIIQDGVSPIPVDVQVVPLHLEGGFILDIQIPRHYSLAEAKVLIEAWRRHYNTVRPHSSLGYRPPAPEAATPPLPASGSASLHLRPAMAAETTMH